MKFFGLYPCTCYCDISLKHNAAVKIDAPPTVLIIPSKENRKELLAIQKFDAFFFSVARTWDGGHRLKDNINQYITQDDLFKKMKAQRRTIQFSLEQALKAAISDDRGLTEIENSMAPLMPSIIKFAGGSGTLTGDDIDFAKKFRDTIFYRPAVPFAQSSEYKRKRTKPQLTTRPR